MDKNEALAIIKRACESVVADFPSHQKIQEAIRVIASELFPDKK